MSSLSYLLGRERLTVVIGKRSITIAKSDTVLIEKVMRVIKKYNETKQKNWILVLEELLFPAKALQRLSDNRFMFDGNSVFLTGTTVPMPQLLGERVLEFIDKGYPLEAMINFWKNCLLNPSENSRQSLYNFIEHNGITITNTGYMILYKGVKEAQGKTLKHSGTIGYYKDKRGLIRRPNGEFAGKAEIDDFMSGNKKSKKTAQFVDCHSGTFDNTPGLVVSMDREKVDPDTNVGCSYGLHVGAYSYASTFGPVTLKVIVNPMDVVSVPDDCNWQKIRVCQYFTSEVINAEHKGIYDDNDYAHIQTAELKEIIPFLIHDCRE